jgi:hypothetical protein
MGFFALVLIFVTASLVASAFAHDERRWPYPAAVAIACAILLVIWTAQLMNTGLGYFSYRIPPVISVLIAAPPYLVVILNLLIRRRNTPRHVPGLDDDPVLRRYLAEKLRRRRRQRQEEMEADAIAAAAVDDTSPSCPEPGLAPGAVRRAGPPDIV